MVIWRKTAITAAVSVLSDPWKQLYTGTWILALSLVSHLMCVPYASKPALQALEAKVLPYCDEIVTLLLQNLQVGTAATARIGVVRTIGQRG